MKRKKKNKKWLPAIVICIVVVATFLLFLLNKTSNSCIGVKIPENYSIHGIDVSHHNRDIDWEQVSNFKCGNYSIRFAFIKASEGLSLKDPLFETNWKNAKEHNISCGAYHYFHANLDPKLQAELFCNTAKLSSGDLAPVLDIEDKKINIDKDLMIERCLTWLKIVENHFKTKPIVYTYASFYEDYLKNSEIDNYPIWIAHYNTSEPDTDADWSFWQYSDNAKINGINSDVDVNVFKGFNEDFFKYCIK